MNLFKTSIWTGISTGVRMISGLVINKMLALYVGASGLALVGQFRDFISLIMSFANGGIQTGVVKYVAEYKEDKEKLTKLIGTAFIINFLCSIVVGFGIFVSRGFLKVTVFESSEYDTALLVFGFTVILFALNTLFMSILNGLREIVRYVFASIISSLIGLIITVGLIYWFKLNGALLALSINQSIVIVGTIFFLKSSDSYRFSYLLNGFDRGTFRKLMNYSLMALTTSLTMPLALMLVRKYLGENLSWTEAGFWEGLWRLSTMYLLVLTTAFSVYLVPTFSELTGDKLRSEVMAALKFVLPATIAMAIVIYIFREVIIKMLFSEEFLPMQQLFAFQLAGDVLKMGGWVFGNIILAKAYTKVFVGVQIGWVLLFGALTFLLVNIFGLQGVVMAYFLSYVGYFVFMNIFFRKLIWKKR